MINFIKHIDWMRFLFPVYFTASSVVKLYYRAEDNPVNPYLLLIMGIGIGVMYSIAIMDTIRNMEKSEENKNSAS